MNIENKIKHEHKKIEYKGLVEQPCNYIIPYSLAQPPSLNIIHLLCIVSIKKCILDFV